MITLKQTLRRMENVSVPCMDYKGIMNFGQQNEKQSCILHMPITGKLNLRPSQI